MDVESNTAVTRGPTDIRNPSWLPKTLESAILYYRDVRSIECSETTLKELERKLILGDLFYLLAVVFKRKDFLHPWLFARCREVQAEPDGCLDLWSRDSRKSSTITFALTIQDILRNPEITVGLFSHTKSIAKGFVNQIKRELESNEKLKYLFDDILYADPQNQAPLWSLDSGLIVKRKNNPKEPTLFAAGVVDGQPTGMHFSLRVMDDVVTAESVSTTDQMQKTLDMLDLADNLGSKGGTVRMIGTRYRLGDAYEEYIKRGIVKPRIYPATDDGTVDGNPVFLTREEWEDKLQRQSPAIIASQMLQNPMASDSVIFQPDWFQLWPADKELPVFDAVFLSVDGAFSEKQTADDSCLLMLGLFKPFYAGPDGELAQSDKYSVMVLDCYMDKVAYPELRDEVLAQYGNRYGANEKLVDACIIEDKASGHALIPDLKRSGVAVHPFKPGGMDKTMRANLVSHLVRDGYVWLPESRNPKRMGKVMSWLGKAYEQWCYFPNVKNDDACFISGTLISTKRGNVPIELVKDGDMVLTPDGWNKVIACGKTGEMDVISNMGLTGTANHPVFQLDLSYQPLEKCIKGKIIGLCLCDFLKIALLKALSSMESDTDGWEESVTIIYRNQQKMMDGKILKVFMSQFGNSILEKKFRKAVKLITKMVIHSILSLQIWNAYQCLCIKDYLRTLTWRKLGKILKGFARWRHNGTNQKREAIGIKSMARRFFSGHARFSIKNASIAKQNTRQKSLPQCIVPKSVGLNTGGKIETNILGKQHVYNLKVDGSHCYFANGILVHNCDALTQALIVLDKQGFLRGKLAPQKEKQYYKDTNVGSYS